MKSEMTITIIPTVVATIENPASISTGKLLLVIFFSVLTIALIFTIIRLILDLRKYRYR